jgi:probable phosphoglycerate mutase
MSLPPNPPTPYYSADPFDPTDPTPNPIDGSFRRRIHLLRHAEVIYLQDDGSVVPDPRAVALTPAGLQQARDVGVMLADVKFDKVLCSGLPRTRQTAEAVVAGRGMAIGEAPGLEEIRSGERTPIEPDRIGWEAAYALWRAGEPDATFHNGERFDEFAARIHAGIDSVVAQPDWHNLLLVLHGAVNRAVLCWALDAPLNSFPRFEQDFCCLNVIDIDVDTQGKVLRKIVRLVNLTPYDLPKHGLRLTTMERAALKLVQLLGL